MKKIYLLIAILTIVLSSCKKDEEKKKLPVLITSDVSDITRTMAVCGGDISSDGGSTITVRGVCWSIGTTPTIANDKTIDGAGGGSFISSISGLTAGTTYYVRAYATNNIGTGYGMAMSFTTQQLTLPVLTTSVVSDITRTTATCGGNIISDGGSTVTARGICWSTGHNPTTSNSHTTDGTGLGSFTSNITNITGSTTYYVRAYATNGVGTAYGNEITFTTLLNLIIPTVTTTSITNVAGTTASSGGNVISDGGASIILRGICWSTNPNPTLANSHTTDGSGTGEFVSFLTNLNLATHYYVRAYAANSVGMAYGDELSFTTSPTVFTIGQSYGGGVIFYIDDSGLHGLIAALSDQGWLEWGCDETIIGGTSTAIGTGQANTTAIVNECSQVGIAARICKNLWLNGYNDWFLPSKDELYQMYLQKNIIGIFSNDIDYYWSSSEINSHVAWSQDFYYGDQSSHRLKDMASYVRAIRAF